jgi:hypothetical protein
MCSFITETVFGQPKGAGLLVLSGAEADRVAMINEEHFVLEFKSASKTFTDPILVEF